MKYRFLFGFSQGICNADLQSWAGYLERNEEIRWSWAGQGNFDIYLCVFFDCYCEFNFCKRGWGLAYGFTKIWDFPHISWFPKSIVVQQPVRQLIYQVCYTRYHVSFYLWWIGFVLKHCEVPKYYDQDCRLAS